AKTASQPLAASPSSVRAAAVLLPVRNTLVAPGFLEPKLRGAARPMARLTTTANGIDPSRYEPIIMPIVIGIMVAAVIRSRELRKVLPRFYPVSPKIPKRAGTIRYVRLIFMEGNAHTGIQR